jgi:hypothetical protein
VVRSLLAGAAAVAHEITALPIEVTRLLTCSIAVAIEHARIVSIGTELRAAKALHGLCHEAAGTKHCGRQKQSKRCFPEFHWFVSFCAADSMYADSERQSGKA